MIEQPTNVGMMKRLRRGSIAIALGNLRVSHKQLNQRFQVRILNRGHEFTQRPPEFDNVLGRLLQVVGEIDINFFHPPEFVDRELITILVLIDQSLDLEEVILIKHGDELVDVIPHLRFDLATAIRQNQRQIRLAILFRFNLLRGHHKAGSDDLVFLLGTVGDKELFHDPPRKSHCVAETNLSETNCSKTSLKHTQLLLLFQLLRVIFFGRCFHRLGLLCARTGVYIPALDVDICFLAESRQVCPQRRLQLLHVQRVLNARLDFFHRRNARRLMLSRLQNHVTLLGADYIRRLPRLQRENRFFQFFRKCSPLEVAQIAAVLRRRSIGILFRQIRELRTLLNLIQQIVGFGLGRGQCRLHLRVRRCNRLPIRSNSWLGCGLWSNQNFAQAHLFRLFHLRLVSVVKFLFFILIHGQFLAHFLPNHPLCDDLVAHVLLELFVGSSLRLCRLLELFHGFKFHFLAHFIQTFYQFRITRNPQVFALLQKKLLVNQIAQHVTLLVGKILLRIRRILLLNFLPQLITAPYILRTRHNFIVDSSNDLLDHDIGG